MRLVVDTNIFASILIRPGETLSALIDHIDQHCTILYSTETLAELVDVLSRRKFKAYTSPQEVAEFVRWVVATGELVAVDVAPAVSRDPKDDKFVALAVAGHADYLVSGDRDLIVLGTVETVPILSPAAFLAAVNH